VKSACDFFYSCRRGTARIISTTVFTTLTIVRRSRQSKAPALHDLDCQNVAVLENFLHARIGRCLFEQAFI